MTTFSELIKGKTPVLVDCFATWCGPCKMMHPVLEELKQQLGDKLIILKVDVDQPANRRFIFAYQVQAVPTLLLFKEGKIIWRQSGALPAAQLKEVLNSRLGTGT